MLGLVDCNNFYASCERVFQPQYRTSPIVVLSNNDGCVIARSNEAKALGIAMGVPFYQIKEKIEQYGIQVFSSNYTLYGDMSNRIMTILSSFSPQVEIYSIDEAFLDLSGMPSLQEYGQHIVKTTHRWTGIPVSMGVAPTKTLAKLANRFAKKYPGYQQLCLIDSEEKRIKALQLSELGDVWGIGKRTERKLRTAGIHTAYDFSRQSRAWVRKQCTVTGERTWLELNGEPCIELTTHTANKKQICTSRSFGQATSSKEDLREAVAYYASLCCEKLREQGGYAYSLLVFIHTNPFKENSAQYSNTAFVQLPVPSQSTMELTRYALKALEGIYREGYQYKKAGVIITEISQVVQNDMFDSVQREKHQRLMQVVDRLNKGFMQNSLQLAAQGLNKNWGLKRQLLSPNYTTQLSDIITVG